MTLPSAKPSAWIVSCTRAHRQLDALVEHVTDEVARRPCLFGPAVGAALQEYLVLQGDGEGPLYQTKQRKRMRAQGLVVLYQRIGRRAQVKGVHPHRFRHTFATMAIQASAREIDVQHLLGHSTSAMERRYTRT